MGSRRTGIRAALLCAALLVGPAPRSSPAAPRPPHQATCAPATRRPSDTRLLGCSPAGAVCIHAAPGSLTALGYRRIRDSAERALRGLDILGLPPLPADDGRGGTFGYDIYVRPELCHPATGVDPLDPVARFDRRSAFSIIGAPAAGAGCRFDNGLARSLAEATLLGLDGVAQRGVIAMHGSYLATLVAPCTAVETEAIDRLQRSPERALLACKQQPLSGALLFPWFLDAGWGAGRPGSVMTGLLAVSLQHTGGGPDAAARDEPDVFDALRHAARRRATSLGDILLDFAVARAYVGSRSDGVHLPDTERYGDLGRPRFEWSVPWSSLPRRLAPLWPVEATGASYLWLDLRGAPVDGAVRFVATWPEGRVWRWALSKVDAHGQEVGRLTAPGKWGDHHLHVTLADVGRLAGVLIVGTHLGTDDRSRPYDPDGPPDEPSLYEVTLAALAE